VAPRAVRAFLPSMGGAGPRARELARPAARGTGSRTACSSAWPAQLAGAAALGVHGTFESPPPGSGRSSPLGVFLVVAYNLELVRRSLPLGRVVRRGVGAFPAAPAYFAPDRHHGLRGGARRAGGVRGHERRAEGPCRRRWGGSQDRDRGARNPGARRRIDGTAGRGCPPTGPEIALRWLSPRMPVLAGPLLVSRLA